MKKILCTLIMVLAGTSVFAALDKFETKQEAYDRRSYENYQKYSQNNHQAPLGGYNRPINDDGGRQYGYSEYQNKGLNKKSSYSNNSNNNSLGDYNW